MDKSGFIYMIKPVDFKMYYETEHIEDNLTKYCEDNNINILEIFTDTSGGTISERPGIIKMLSLLEENQYVICSTISQLSWEQSFLFEIQRHIKNVKAKLIIHDLEIDYSTIHGEHLFATTGALDTYKIKLTQNVNIVNGPHTMNRYGWSLIGGEYIEIKREQRVLDTIKKLIQISPMVQNSSIVEILNANQLTTVRFNKHTIQPIVTYVKNNMIQVEN